VSSAGADDRTPLLQRTARALGWSFFNTAAARLGTLGIGIVLARLLGPAEFGTYAVAMVALLAVLSFNELGVSLAIVRWPGDPRAILPTVTTISTAGSVAVYLAAYAGAPAFATAMGDPGAAGVVRLLALSVVLSGLVATPAALLQRHFRQDRRMLVDQVNTWVGALTSVGLAIGGMGALSLAIGRLAGSGIAAVLFVRLSPEPLRFGFDPRAARALLRFGLPLAGSSLVVFGVTSVDQLVVGNVLGATALGFYVLAFNLSSWPVAMFSQPVRSVAPAAFARLQHDPATMRRAFTTSVGLLAAVTLPVCLLLVGAAEPLIRFVYGPAWVPAAKALTWLAALGALRILYELVYDYFVVLAKSRVVLMVQLAWLAALVPALVVGAHAGGLAGVASAHVAVAVVVVLPLYLRELRRVGIPLAQLAGQVAVPLLAAALTGAIAVAAAHLVRPEILALALAGLVTSAAIGLLVLRKRGALRSYLSASPA
jgi:O-antigen/teichoic acid export membrane protein